MKARQVLSGFITANCPSLKLAPVSCGQKANTRSPTASFMSRGEPLATISMPPSRSIEVVHGLALENDVAQLCRECELWFAGIADFFVATSTCTSSCLIMKRTGSPAFTSPAWGTTSFAALPGEGKQTAVHAVNLAFHLIGLADKPGHKGRSRVSDKLPCGGPPVRKRRCA